MRNIELEGVENVRDLGGIPVSGNRMVKSGLMYRGAALKKATPSDCQKLSKELGVKLVVDLRCGWEVEAKPDCKLDGVRHIWVPFYDEQEVGVGYCKPLPGTIMIGHDFACDSLDFYRSMANDLTAAQMSKALHAVLDCAISGNPVYFHCSGGKDRAGILSLLVLTVLGASRGEVLDDYLLTNVSREFHIEGIYRRFLRLCRGNEEFARQVTNDHSARPENIEAFCSEVDRRYGSMKRFITEVLGIDDEYRARAIEDCTTEIDPLEVCKTGLCQSAKLDENRDLVREHAMASTAGVTC